MERALIVNDDQLMSYAISKALHPYHPEIKTVSNGDDAMNEISSCFIRYVSSMSPSQDCTDLTW
jgi:CheY-like chemotaxis protein